MTEKYDICVIGAGSGGLVVAAAAAEFNQKVVLIERDKMGGDCLNYGCVPSKALIAAAKHAHALGTGEAFGVGTVKAKVDFTKVHDHVHRVIAKIAPHDSQERMEGLGIRVIRGEGRFHDEETVEVAGEHITARRFVIATGSSAAVPPIPGLDQVNYLTNENLFDNKTLPKHLIIIGGGPIGMEMAQAYCRLGAKVTVIEAAQPLLKEDRELSTIVLNQLRAEGVEILVEASAKAVRRAGKGVAVEIAQNGVDKTITGSHLLVATGRKPNINGLNLDAAAIEYERFGIKVDKALRTSNRKVYAIGDCIGGLQFTHVAAYHAGLVIRSVLFRLPIKAKTNHIPRVTFTSPELAQVGLNEAEAKAAGHEVRILYSPFSKNDRAMAENETTGMVKLVVGSRGKILGAGIVGANAGEMIHVWAMAISSRRKLKAVIDMVVAYPTMTDASRNAAINYYRGLNENSLIRRIIEWFKFFK